MVLMMLTTLLKRTSKMTNEYSNYIVRALASHGELWSCLEFAKDNNVKLHTKTVNYCWSMLDAPKTVANTFEKQDLIREMWHILKAHNHRIFMNVLGTATRENNAWLSVQLVECIPSYPKHHQTFMYEKVFDFGQRCSIDISKTLFKHWKLSALRNDPRSYGWLIGWIKHKQSLLKNLEVFLAELAMLGPFPVEFEEILEAMSARVGVELDQEMREAVRELARTGVDIE